MGETDNDANRIKYRWKHLSRTHLLRSHKTQFPRNNRWLAENEIRDKWVIYDSFQTYGVILSSLVVFNLIRVSSIPAWILPWLQWTFSELEEEEADENVSINLNIYGLMFYASLIISPIPGAFLSCLRRCFGGSKRKSEVHGLTVLLAFAVILSVVISLQMCLKGSMANAIAVVIEFSFLRTVFFITRSMVCKTRKVDVGSVGDIIFLFSIYSFTSQMSILACFMASVWFRWPLVNIWSNRSLR